MTKFLKSLTVLSIALIVVSVPLIVASALDLAAPMAQSSDPGDLDNLVTTWKSLSGLALLFTAVINVLKRTSIVRDGQAGLFSTWFNAAGLLFLLLLQAAGYMNALPTIDANAASAANLIDVIFAFIYQIGLSRFGHKFALSGLPWVGTSFSKSE